MKGKIQIGLAIIFLGCVFVSCEKDNFIENIPIANAGDSQTVKFPQDSVVLRGSATENGGKIVGYLWSEVAGPNTPLIHTPGSAVTTVSGLVPGDYLFQLMVTDSTGETGLAKVAVKVTASSWQSKSLYLRPGPTDGFDVVIAYVPGYDDGNTNHKPLPSELSASQWTYYANGANEGTSRSLIKFQGLSVLPANAVVDSAFFSLYGKSSYLTAPQGNSYYPGSPYTTYGDNKCWLQRITANWSDVTVTWNSQPPVTTINQVEMAPTTSQYNYNANHINVTPLIRDMISILNPNYGFMMRMENETIYRNAIFASSWVSDSTLRPKLEVFYRVPQ